MRPKARSLALSLLMVAGGGLVAVSQAAPAAAALPHVAGGFTAPTTRQDVRPKVGVSAALPETASLKLNLPAVGDQGQIGSCVAWTIAHSIMGYYAQRDSAAGAPYAPLYLYMRAVQKGGAPNAGLVPEKALTEAAANGVDTQDDYVQGTTNYTVPPTASEVANARNYKISKWATLWTGAGQGAAGQRALQEAIVAGSPVAVGIPVFKDFMYLTGNTLYKTTSGVNLGGHMVTAYAYDAEGLWIRNQWGTSWGVAGDAHLSWAFVNANVSAAYTVGGMLTPSTVPVSRPSVSTLSQVRGPVAGGTEVTITGGNLSTATAVRFGDATAQFRKVETNGVTTLVATTPPHARGSVDVTVVNAAGASTLNSQARFLYQPPPPVVAGLSAASASVLGGDVLGLTGTNLDGATAVRIGANAATNVKVLSPTSIAFTVPKLTVGIYDVTVVTPSGTSATVAADKLAIVNPPAPTIASLSVTSGPTYTTTPVIVTGTNLSGVTAVRVGDVSTLYQRVSDTQLRVTMPVHAAGQVTVKITTVGGVVEGTAAPFTYVAPPPPTVAAVTPATGGTRSWTTVEISGTNFGTAERVTSNGAVVSFVKLSESRLKVYLPPRAPGTVQLQVITKGGVSAAAPASIFTYKV
ncbi:IPT/TIG domain-containing protein [Dactylosporangium aurantiacum]|uniref:IPT/TIG domain-containing protein n=1 Tax=Dactylosporangium aurantiacum TaxID=35754 RepID=A0A9Q9MM35_9ACTN|nr:IPT/TIG domain-containing protein [Dactylosporangium aurantiacum]MDG6110297.1 IPT/TIG domain-containing protein [Dactylosporangium aurantiacum]UWZ54387.1 IPT/TIG domain-containing protein [Dactylosporangium aurantiacum]